MNLNYQSHSSPVDAYFPFDDYPIFHMSGFTDFSISILGSRTRGTQQMPLVVGKPRAPQRNAPRNHLRQFPYDAQAPVIRAGMIRALPPPTFHFAYRSLRESTPSSTYHVPSYHLSISLRQRDLHVALSPCVVLASHICHIHRESRCSLRYSPFVFYPFAFALTLRIRIWADV